MQAVTQIIDERLADAGGTLAVKGHLDEAGYALGGHAFALPNGIDYDLMLTNAGEGILATGILTAHVVGTCDRCLEPAVFDVAAEVDEYYLFHEPSEAASEGVDQYDPDADVDYALVNPDHTITLTDALSSALIMETPYVVLCKDDCRGLCPVCGANLNQGDCEHVATRAERQERERLDASPFAVLRNLDLGAGDAPARADSPEV